MKTILLASLLVLTQVGYARVDSDNFAQVRGFKLDMAGSLKNKVASSSTSVVLKRGERINLVKMLNDMPDVIIFKTLPIPGAQIKLSSGISAEHVKMRLVVQESPYLIVDELSFHQSEEGVQIELKRLLGTSQSSLPKPLVGSPLGLEVYEQAVITAREAGSGIATGRRMGPVICLGADCIIAQELLDLRQMLKKAIMGKEGSRVQVIRAARIAGEYPSSLITASTSLEKISGLSVKIGEDEILGFNFEEEEKTSISSNPLYQASGNSGENPMFEGQSSLKIKTISLPSIPAEIKWRCEDGRKPVGSNVCGDTNHL